MKLLLVQYRPAIRLYKWAETLSKCYKVDIAYTTGLGLGLNWKRFNTIKLPSIRNFKQYDRYISFNPRLNFSYRKDVTTIQAVGDLKNANNPHAREVTNLKSSYKSIFVSQTQREFAHSIAGDINSDVYINGALRDMVGLKKPKIQSGKLELVYSGTIVNKPNSHRNIIDKLREIKRKNDCNIHIYPSHISNGKGYEEFIVHASVSPYDLISELSMYHGGVFVLSSFEDVMNMSLPNKVFEYLAAGLPVYSEPYTEISKADGVYLMDDFKITPVFEDQSIHAKYYDSDLCEMII
jgi:hypothetical protein